MNFVQIPSGRFMMGSYGGKYNDFWKSDIDVSLSGYPGTLEHEVYISEPYYLGTTVVTQKQWCNVMKYKPWLGGSKEYKQRIEKYLKKQFSEACWIEPDGSPKYNSLYYWDWIFSAFKEEYHEISEAIIESKIDGQCSWIKNSKYKKIYKQVRRAYKHFCGYFRSGIELVEFAKKAELNPREIDTASKNLLKEVDGRWMFPSPLTDFEIRTICNNDRLDEINSEEINDLIEHMKDIIIEFKADFVEWLIGYKGDLFELVQIQIRKNHHEYIVKDYFEEGDEFPAVEVSYRDIKVFIASLNRKKLPCKFRLPTEAEWEFACRGASYNPANEEKKYSRNAWSYNWDEKVQKIKPVALKSPNEFGLYDMCGNVWEMCSDWFAPYNEGIVVDPKGPKTPYSYKYTYRGDVQVYSVRSGKVTRGGSVLTMYDHRTYCSGRAAAGTKEPIGFRHVAEPIGFRLVAEPR